MRGKKGQSRRIIVELKIVKDYLTHIERIKSFYVECRRCEVSGVKIWLALWFISAFRYSEKAVERD